MNDVFLDTVGLIAVWDESDQWHQAADDAYRNFLSQARRLVTTEFVLLEFGTSSVPIACQCASEVSIAREVTDCTDRSGNRAGVGRI